MSNVLITNAGASHAISAGSPGFNGPFFPIQYFVLVYDPRMDPTIHSVDQALSTDVLSFSATNAIEDTSPIETGGHIIFNRPGYTISDQEHLILSGGESIVAGTSADTLSNSSFNDITPITFFEGNPLLDVISAADQAPITTDVGIWKLDKPYTQLSATNATNGFLTDKDNYFKVSSYSPIQATATSADGTGLRGIFKCRVDQSFGDFRFNKIALFSTRYENGVETTDPPVLFAMAGLNEPVQKTVDGFGLANLEFDIEIQFNALSTLEPSVFLTTDYWLRVPTGLSGVPSFLPTSGTGGLFFDGEVAISTSGHGWLPKAKLDISDPRGEDQLRLNFDWDNSYYKFNVNAAETLRVESSSQTGYTVKSDGTFTVGISGSARLEVVSNGDKILQAFTDFSGSNLQIGPNSANTLITDETLSLGKTVVGANTAIINFCPTTAGGLNGRILYSKIAEDMIFYTGGGVRLILSNPDAKFFGKLETTDNVGIRTPASATAVLTIGNGATTPLDITHNFGGSFDPVIKINSSNGFLHVLQATDANATGTLRWTGAIDEWSFQEKLSTVGNVGVRTNASSSIALTIGGGTTTPLDITHNFGGAFDPVIKINSTKTFVHVLEVTDTGGAGTLRWTGALDEWGFQESLRVVGGLTTTGNVSRLGDTISSGLVDLEFTNNLNLIRFIVSTENFQFVTNGSAKLVIGTTSPEVTVIGDQLVSGEITVGSGVGSTSLLTGTSLQLATAAVAGSIDLEFTNSSNLIRFSPATSKLQFIVASAARMVVGLASPQVDVIGDQRITSNLGIGTLPLAGTKLILKETASDLLIRAETGVLNGNAMMLFGDGTNEYTLGMFNGVFNLRYFGTTITILTINPVGDVGFTGKINAASLPTTAGSSGELWVDLGSGGVVKRVP